MKQKEKKFQRLLILNLFITLIMGLFFIYQLLSIPVDSKNQVIFGLSRNRIFILLIFGFLFSLMVFLITTIIRRWSKFYSRLTILSNHRLFRAFNWLLVLMFLCLWVTINLPDYFLQDYAAFFQRLRPFLTWLAFIIVQYFILILTFIGQLKTNSVISNTQGQMKYLIAVLIFLFLFCLFWVFFEGFVFSSREDSLYFGGTVVPLLETQLIFTLFFTISITILLTRYWSTLKSHEKTFDTLIFLAIWIITILVWSSQPIIPSTLESTLPAPRFSPPRAPNYEISPLTDSLHYDETANLVIIGERNTGSTDKSMFVSFLTTINLVVGFNYESKVRFQILIFSLFPALLYLLGKSFHSRPAGLMISILAIIRELNTLKATNQIVVSSTQMFYSEFASAFTLVLFLLYMARWTNRQNNPKLLFISGGLLGISLLTRLDSLLVYPVLMISIFVFYRINLKQKFHLFTLFSAGMLICMLPWAIYCYYSYGDALFFVKAKTQGVVYEKRYLPILENETITQGTQTYTVPATPEISLTDQPSSDLDQSGNRNDEIAVPGKESLFTPPIIQLIKLTVAQFVNNVSTSLFVIPPSFTLHDFYHAIRITPWAPNPVENDMNVSVIAIFTNLAVLATGLASSFRRFKINALFPFFVFLSYLSVRSIAIQSAGRNIVPVDWIVFFYFSIGVIELLSIILSCLNVKLDFLQLVPDNTGQSLDFSIKKKKVISLTALFLTIGFIPVLLELIFPRRYPVLNRDELVEIIRNNNELSLSLTDPIEKLLEQDSSRIFIGRALYPQFYREGDGDDTIAFLPKEFPSLGFELLGLNRASVVLPISAAPSYFPNGSDVIVFGCPEDDYFRAELVVLLKSSSIRDLKTLDLTDNFQPQFFYTDMEPDGLCDLG